MNNKQKQIKKLEKREDNRKLKEWAKAVKERDGDKCVICDKTEKLNAHHIIPREVKEFRYLVINGITLCQSHHKFSLQISPHRNPFVFFIDFLKNRPGQFIALYNKYLEYLRESLK